ncbi:MAG: GatB/YqeY domain-containing protein [Solirubrobacteraceae bacterium]|nr:GatB/YqeY domain-containing protein [Solirubrobacteraceae bacterium]
MAIVDDLTTQITEAQKSRDAERRDALRLIRDAIQKEIKDASDGAEVDQLAILRRERKRRLQSAEIYAENGRDDLAAAEQSEADLIDTFLPKQLDEAALSALVDQAIVDTGATSKRDMGAVMKAVMAAADGQAEGKTVSMLVGQKRS